MNIRRAENKDIDAISKLLSQVLNVHHEGRPDLFKSGAVKYLPEELMEIIADDKRPIFVAELDEKVCGYAFCVFQQHIGYNSLTGIKTLYIDDLCVDSAMRGKHIGKSLFEYAKKFAKDAGCYNLTLNVWECNESAMKFYESCGLSIQKRGMEQILD